MKMKKASAKAVCRVDAGPGPHALRKFGPYVFMLGFAISALAALLLPTSQAAYTLVALLGLAVGLLNVCEEEVQGFLIASIAFLVSVGGFLAASQSNGFLMIFRDIPVLDMAMVPFLNLVLAFVGPAAMIAAFRQIWIIAKD